MLLGVVMMQNIRSGVQHGTGCKQNHDRREDQAKRESEQNAACDKAQSYEKPNGEDAFQEREILSSYEHRGGESYDQKQSHYACGGYQLWISAIVCSNVEQGKKNYCFSNHKKT